MEEEFITMSVKEISRLEVMEKITSKRITQVEASKLLGLTTRHVIRLYQAYKKEGAKGLISKCRGQPSNNKLPQALKDEVAKLTKQHYIDFGPTFAHEWIPDIKSL